VNGCESGRPPLFGLHFAFRAKRGHVSGHPGLRADLQFAVCNLQCLAFRSHRSQPLALLARWPPFPAASRTRAGVHNCGCRHGWLE
jgi:hypothetical protein